MLKTVHAEENCSADTIAEFKMYTYTHYYYLPIFLCIRIFIYMYLTWISIMNVEHARKMKEGV